jgi:hypothetical protein
MSFCPLICDTGIRKLENKGSFSIAVDKNRTHLNHNIKNGVSFEFAKHKNI